MSLFWLMGYTDPWVTLVEGLGSVKGLYSNLLCGSLL